MLITLALPAYNEEENIASVLTSCVDALKELPYKWEIIVIDNASTDGTVKRVHEFCESQPQARLVVHESNRLYSGSCATALKEAKGERIAIMDSDGQHVPSDISRFLAEIDKGSDLVIGWRRYRHDPISRKLFSRVFNLMGRYYLGYGQHDLNCGFRMLNRTLAQRIAITHRINLSNPEIYSQARRAGAKVGEVEVQHYAREKGRSTMNMGKIIRMFASVNRYFQTLRDEMEQPLPESHISIAHKSSSKSASESSSLNSEPKKKEIVESVSL